MDIKFAPSDFAYLHADCPRCSYRKMRFGVTRPSGAFPGLFNALDREWRSQFNVRTHMQSLKGVPLGLLHTHPVKRTVSGTGANGVRWNITGTPDGVLEFDDGTWGVLDLKVSGAAAERMALTYAPQLHAYALMLAQPVSWLGLMVARVTLSAPVHYDIVPIEYNPERFMAYLDALLDRAAGPLPEPDPDCPYCAAQRYVDPPLAPVTVPMGQDREALTHHLTAEELSERVYQPFTDLSMTRTAELKSPKKASKSAQAAASKPTNPAPRKALIGGRD